MNKTWIYILVMIFATNLVRVLPMLIIRKRITNRFVQSFLYYVPYVTLAVMTFPAITEATSSPIAGLAALIFGIVSAWMGLGLFYVSLICCVTVFLIEMF